MGLFDKMFGRGASEAQQQPNGEQRFNALKQKYQSVLNAADQQHIQSISKHVVVFNRATVSTSPDI